MDKNTDEGEVSEVKAAILQRHVVTGFSDAALSPNLATSNKKCVRIRQQYLSGYGIPCYERKEQ